MIFCIDSGIELKRKHVIGDRFINLFVNIDSTLASEIQQNEITFKSYLTANSSKMENSSLKWNY